MWEGQSPVSQLDFYENVASVLTIQEHIWNFSISGAEHSLCLACLQVKSFNCKAEKESWVLQMQLALEPLLSYSTLSQEGILCLEE